MSPLPTSLTSPARMRSSTTAAIASPRTVDNSVQLRAVVSGEPQVRGGGKTSFLVARCAPSCACGTKLKSGQFEGSAKRLRPWVIGNPHTGGRPRKPASGGTASRWSLCDKHARPVNRQSCASANHTRASRRLRAEATQISPAPAPPPRPRPYRSTPPDFSGHQAPRSGRDSSKIVDTIVNDNSGSAEYSS